ncbi:MAG: hypothetical protein DCF30_10625 [Hyphomicrobiales bacterium]|nr:MAG: hypothetical protein DCF30_10625 [Hyphomicrobiales bacterium]
MIPGFEDAISTPESIDSTSQSRSKEIRTWYIIADVPSFDEEPRFGASVLAEIASRHSQQPLERTSRGMSREA